MISAADSSVPTGKEMLFEDLLDLRDGHNVMIFLELEQNSSYMTFYLTSVFPQFPSMEFDSDSDSL